MSPRDKTLGDKLHYLAVLEPHEVKAIERIVDYRIQQHTARELEQIRFAIVIWPKSDARKD